MNYFVMARNSLKKNIGKQTTFIITCIVSSTLYFLYGTLIYNRGRKVAEPTNLLGITLKSSMAIIIIMLGCFIIYSYTSYIRRRSRDFKILMLLGMTKKELIICLLLENLFLMLICVGIGIILGTIFSRFFFILTINYVGSPNLSFSLSKINYIYTLYFFIVLYLFTAKRTGKLIRSIDTLNKVKTSKCKGKMRETMKAVLLMFFIAMAIYTKAKEKQNIHLYAWIVCMLILYVMIFYISKIVMHILRRKNSFYKNNFLLMKQLVRNIEQDDVFIFFLSCAGFLFITYNVFCHVDLFIRYSKHISSQELNIFKFISIFTNIVFCAISSSIMYFKSQMELENTYDYFKKLYMLGMTKEEHKLLIKYRLISVFFTPITLYSIVSIVFITTIEIYMGITIFTEVKIIALSYFFTLYGYNKAKKLYYEINML